METPITMSPATLFSTKRISKELVKELISALKSIDAYGSVEIYVQNATVTQITVRNIKKTANPHHTPVN